MSVIGGHQRMAGPLTAAVAQLCRELEPQVSPATAAGLDEVLRRLAAPLQVAVAGRIKSGKSTLVNALIGRRVAPTAIGECTRLVTRFHYGTVDRLEVIFVDGSKQVLPLTADGMIPAKLGVELAQVSHLEVYLTSAVLKEFTVIDTPGLGSLDDGSVARTERQVLGVGSEKLDDVSRNAVIGAEAVLYVITQGARADDHDALGAFLAATASRDAGPINAIGVLNKADLLTPPDNMGMRSADQVWQTATALADQQAQMLKPRVAEVVPMISLLAETTETGRFSHADAEALRQLAGLDSAARGAMLLSPDLFVTWETPVPAAHRQRLLELLDLYGITLAIDLLTRDPQLPAGALRRELMAASGLDQVRARLNSVFRARIDGIKAAAALASITALTAVSGWPPERQFVHNAIEELLAKPEAHQLQLLEALTLITSGQVSLPADLTAEVLRIGSSPEPAEQLGLVGLPAKDLAAYALERAAWWRGFVSLSATPGESRVGYVVHRAYFLLWQQLHRAAP